MSLSIKHLNPPEYLERQILLVIYRKEKARVLFQSGLSVLSFIAFFPLTYTLVQSLSNSGLSQYLSLLFSGDGMLVTYWQELTLSIIESLPILSITILLTFGILFMYSLNRVIANGRQFLSLKLIV